MATITLYKTRIYPDKNMKVDDISSYLQNLPVEDKLILREFQYFTPKMTNEITVLLNQSEYEIGDFNYAVVSIGANIFYYFIVEYNWSSSESVKLNLVLDTVNTFNYEFTHKTKISRQHMDRLTPTFEEEPSHYYQRLIYRVSEGLSPVLYKKRDIQLIDNDFNMNFYLLYRNKLNPNIERNENPVECFLIPEYPQLIHKKTTEPIDKVFKYSELVASYPSGLNYSYYAMDTFNNPNGEIIVTNSVEGFEEHYYNDEFTSYIVLGKNKMAVIKYELGANNEYEVKSYNKFEPLPQYLVDNNYRFKNCTSLGVGGDANSEYYKTDYYVLAQLSKRVAINDGYTRDIKTIGITGINRSDPRNIKLILLPYSPDHFIKNELGELVFNPNKWFFTEGMLRLNDLSAEFIRRFNNTNNPDWSYKNDIYVDRQTLDPHLRRSVYFESQLYHSDYFNTRVIYDSYYTDIHLEDLYNEEPTDSSKYPINVTFKVSATFNGAMLFKLDFNSTNPVPVEFQSISDYPFTFVVNRNNELPLFNSSYIDYVKNGYNYDRKAKERTDRMNWLNTGLSVGGSVLGFALAPFTGGLSAVAGAGFVTSTISSIASNLTSTMQNEDNIRQKLQTANNTPVTISTNNDVDLMKYYTMNRLKKETFKISDVMEQQLGDLFYYFGINWPYQGLPNINTRIWFNYIQCDADFTETTVKSVRKEFLDDIKARYKLGVTHYHSRSGEYDFDQIYENWETGLYQ